MSSTSQETRARLDDSLVLPVESWGHLKAGRSIELKEVVAQLKLAAEAAEKLRSFVLSERPGASWKNRQELDAILESIDKEIRVRTLRSQLLDLAAELERGRVAHRRAARVEQLNQYRDQAIKELRTKAGSKAVPAVLPGPAADQWFDWACALEEPGDTKALETLRSSFPALDDFVSHLEPGMWQVEAAPEATQPRTEKSRYEIVQKDLRERLRNLASELERGSIVHHRAVRVSQLNQLRDQSVKELRDQASAKGMPSPLPGPAVDEWVEWAYSLREPEDAEAVESIRNGFPHLDDFIAHLEPNMWVPGTADFVAPVATVDKPAHSEPVPVAAAAAGASSSRSAAVVTPPAPRMQAPPLLVDEDEEDSLGDRLRQKSKSVTSWVQARRKPASVENASDKNNPKGKRTTIVVSAAVALVAILGIVGWRSHRMHSTVSVVRAEGPAPSITANQATDPNGANPVNGQAAGQVADVALKDSTNGGVTVTTPANAGSPSDASKAPKPKEETTPASADSTKKAAQLDDGQLRTPTAIPKAGKGSGAAPAESAPDLLALARPSSGNRVLPDVASVPVAKPQFSGQREKVSSGVTQGLLMQSVKPVYPLQAQQAHVQGTVVLNAVIGKDGSVESVKVVSGHPMLTQAAMDAVKRWRYKPYYLNGEAVEAETEIKIKFTPQ
jgi:periplasmic protein TonB